MLTAVASADEKLECDGEVTAVEAEEYEEHASSADERVGAIIDKAGCKRCLRGLRKDVGETRVVQRGSIITSTRAYWKIYSTHFTRKNRDDPQEA